jgi:anaerobic selenocysteine-containing dehydrogenase
MSKGFLCPKGLSAIEYMRHKDRILYPMKRKGERGKGGWERISWEEALETVTERMGKAKALYGPQSVIMLRGAAKGLPDILLSRLGNAFGSPNITSMGFLCFVPRVYAYNATFGCFLYPDYDYPPATLVLWGVNPSETFPPLFRRILKAKEKGTKLIVVDPRRTESAQIADLWIRPRPSSDILLCLSVIHEVIRKGLYDASFVERWTLGFDRLERHVEGFQPQVTEPYTGVSPEEITAFLSLYTQGPSAIQEGNGIEQSLYTFQMQRALYVLEAITGNIGRPGGKTRWRNPKLVERYGPLFTLQDLIPREVRERRIGAERLAPFAHYALPQAIVQAILDGSGPKVAFIMGGNLLLSWPDSKRTLEALGRLEFICVSDLFLTPTVMMADIVLPAATFLEFDSIHMPPDFTYFAHVQQKVCQVGEARSDVWIVNELAKKLGLKEYFFKDEYELYDEVLKEEGITFEEFRRIGFLLGRKEYRFYEREGFRTKSGKVELWSPDLESYGLDPLPKADPSSLQSDPSYPLLLTSYKPYPFRHSNFRQLDSTRMLHPYPLVLIDGKTAASLGVKDGEWILVETRKGAARAKAKVDDVKERVVVMEHGWWLPEDGTFLDHNINVLTSADPPFARETGTPLLRGVPCRIRRL